MRKLYERREYPDCTKAILQYIPTRSGVEVVISPTITTNTVSRLYVRRRSDEIMLGQVGEDTRRWIIDWYYGPREVSSAGGGASGT